MLKIVIYLNDEEQARLERVSKLMIRDPRDQAYVILINELHKLDVLKAGSDGRK